MLEQKQHDETYGTQTRKRRIPFSGRVAVNPKDGTPPVLEEIFDLSMGGMFIKCMLPLPPGTVIDLGLSITSYKLRISAKVLWTRRVEKSEREPAGMAVEFLNLTEAQKKLLYLQIDSYLKTGGALHVGTPPSQDSEPAPPPTKGHTTSGLTRTQIWLLVGLAAALAIVATIVVVGLL